VTSHYTHQDFETEKSVLAASEEACSKRVHRLELPEVVTPHALRCGRGLRSGEDQRTHADVVHDLAFLVCRLDLMAQAIAPAVEALEVASKSARHGWKYAWGYSPSDLGVTDSSPRKARARVRKRIRALKSGEVDAVLRIYVTAYQRRAGARRKSHWLHPTGIALFGLLIGVLAMQGAETWLQGVIPDFLPAFLVVALFAGAMWALFDYVVEPPLDHWLARREARLVADEATKVHEAWRDLRFGLRRYGIEGELPLFQTLRFATP
jgi:hypothetical protein